MASKRLVARCGPILQLSRPRQQASATVKFSRQLSVAPPALLNPTRSLTAAFEREEDDEFSRVEEKEWAFDDISSMAHDELEQHREARDYARTAAYEMPLLASW